jgi:hypothetical protein
MTSFALKTCVFFLLEQEMFSKHGHFKNLSIFHHSRCLFELVARCDLSRFVLGRKFASVFVGFVSNKRFCCKNHRIRFKWKFLAALRFAKFRAHLEKLATLARKIRKNKREINNFQEVL